MAKDPESRPISVSELLARSRSEAGDDTSAPESGQFAASGRRRVGRDGALSVAELTGEIPKITGPEPTASTAPRSSSPLVTRGESAFPRSSSPAPTSSSGARTASGMPNSTPPVVADDDAQQPRDVDANAITGIIPLVDDEPADTGDDLDFEAYRNFADYETDDPTGTSGGKTGPDKTKKDKTKKEKRGLFGRKKSADRARAATGKGVSPSQPEPVPAQPPVGFGLVTPTPVVDEPGEQPPAIRRSEVPVEPGPAIVPSVRRSAPPAADDDADTGPAITPHVVMRTAPAENTVDDTQEIGVVPSVAPAVTPAVSASSTAQTVVSTPQPLPVTPAVEPSALPPIATDDRYDDFADVEPQAASDAVDEIPDEAPLNSKHSPVMAWLLLIGQTILGLAIGAGLFWGFTELWKWNVIFALVLAAVVIFGIVTLVHVVRRRHDLISTLLAVGVALIVTIGPLVLLASSST